MDCEQALEAISAALDGELSPAERLELEAHLSVCESCRALAEDFRVLTAALDGTEAAPPPELAENVMARTASITPILAGKRKHGRRWLGLAAMLALVICVGGVGLWLRGAGMIKENLAASGNAAPMEPPSNRDGAGWYSAVQSYSGNNEGEEPTEVGLGPEANADGAVEDTLKAMPPEADPGTAALPSAVSVEPEHYPFTNARAVRVTWTDAPDLPAARILGSVEAVEELAAAFPEDDLNEELEGYDAAYFTANSLLAVVVEETSGSIQLSIPDEGLERNQVNLVRTAPETQTGDMAAWVILAEVDTMFEDGEELEVIFSD